MYIRKQVRTFNKVKKSRLPEVLKPMKIDSQIGTEIFEFVRVNIDFWYFFMEHDYHPLGTYPLAQQ